MYIKICRLLGLALASFVFVACGGGSSSSSYILTENSTSVSGHFIDAAVSGLNYECSPSGTLGVTDQDGKFTCDINDSVSFKLGNIPLGVSVEINSGDVITPYTLFENNHDAALNLAQLLQTIDDDGDLSNGITPNPVHIESLGDSLDFTSLRFDRIVPRLLDGINSLVDEDQAEQHMRDSLATLDITPPEPPVNPAFISVRNTDNCNEIYLLTKTSQTRFLEDYCMVSDPSDQIKTANQHFMLVEDAQTEATYLVSTDGINTTMINFETTDDTVFTPNELLLVEDTIFLLGSVGNVGSKTELGKSLWISDGTQEGTSKLTTLDYISNMTQVGSKVIFKADSLTGVDNDYELWVSDGTVDGTKLLKNINPDGNSHPYRFFQIEDKTKVYFSIQDGPTNNALWITDGTSEGTQIIKEVTQQGTEMWILDALMLGNKLFFQYSNELWVSDGTENGTNLVTSYNSFNSITKFDENKVIYKTGNQAGSYGISISNGDTVTDVPNTNNISIGSNSFKNINGTVYYNDDFTIYSISETNISEVGSLSSNHAGLEFFNMNNETYLKAELQDNGTYNDEMFKVSVAENGNLSFNKLNFVFPLEARNYTELYNFDEYVVDNVYYGHVFYETLDGNNLYQGIAKIDGTNLSVVYYEETVGRE